MISNVREVRTRGGYVILLCLSGAVIPEDAANQIIRLPYAISDDLFTALPAIVPLQLLAYYTAVQRGCDVDKPRNLAKSVTVE